MSVEIEGTADEIGSEVALPEQPAPLNLFHTSDPVEVLERAARVADALKGVIDQRKLFKRIGNKDHVLVEGWATCGAMLGLTAATVWSRAIGEPSSEKGHDWEARVEVRTLDGRVIGAAEAMCTRKEQTWKSRDDYALRSMAQTRATSKALRGPLGFIVTLAGYSATPAEEMPSGGSEPLQDAPNWAPTERDIKHDPEKSDLPAEDVWWTKTYPQIKELADGDQLRAFLVDDLQVPVPSHVGSWKKLLTALPADKRAGLTLWLQDRVDAKADVPWPSPEGPSAEDASQLALEDAKP